MLNSLAFFTLIFASRGWAQCQEGSPPAFGSAHHVQGTLFIPYAEIKEPFEAWYDLERASSRIDYYGDYAQTYQLGAEGDYGSSIKVVYVTTEKVVNEQQCLQVNGSSDDGRISPQRILPDLSQFECIGTEKVGEMELEKWRYVDNMIDKVSKYTMWIRWKKSPKTKKLMRPIPVKYEMRGYNSLLGSHYDHYYLEYHNYDEKVPDQAVFQVKKGLKCQSFPGPGLDHVYTFNPMAEFVGGQERHVEGAWEEFKAKHRKDQEMGTKEHAFRKEAFRQNMRYIHSTNRANLGYQLAVNHLADRTDLELRALRGRTYSGEHNGGEPFPYKSNSFGDVPDQFDWRLYGAVTPVKDQSVCGSCWSFGSTGTIEGAYFIKTGKLMRFSQQALIDCSWGFGNNGCDGGEDFRSYGWIQKHGGIPTEADYGDYLGQDGKCHIGNGVTMYANIAKWVNVTSDDEDALRLAIFKNGPISVAIDASRKSFTFYSSGVYYDPECKNKIDELDHAVLAVGYGQLNGMKYWLVKNSWSNYWGNDGYVLMSSKENNCGVMTSPTYVILK